MPAENFRRPDKIILDTDMGNDVDDALADRNEAELLAVVLSKDNPWAAVYVDIINNFYGRDCVPVGKVVNGMSTDEGSFIRQVSERRPGREFLYSRKLENGREAPGSVKLHGMLSPHSRTDQWSW